MTKNKKRVVDQFNVSQITNDYFLIYFQIKFLNTLQEKVQFSN